MAYEGSIDLISGIRAKNNGAFPLVNAKDVYVDDDLRLDAALPVYGTNAEWAAVQRTFVPQRGRLVVYADRVVGTDAQGNPVTAPGFKVGDGTTYVADLPFADAGMASVLSASLAAHIADASAHLQAGERDKWNRKITTGSTANDFQEVVNGTLVLSKD